MILLKLPNHRLFDPNKEDQREEYFYFMLLLFLYLSEMKARN